MGAYSPELPQPAETKQPGIVRKIKEALRTERQARQITGIETLAKDLDNSLSVGGSVVFERPNKQICRVEVVKSQPGSLEINTDEIGFDDIHNLSVIVELEKDSGRLLYLAATYNDRIYRPTTPDYPYPLWVLDRTQPPGSSDIRMGGRSLRIIKTAHQLVSKAPRLHQSLLN